MSLKNSIPHSLKKLFRKIIPKKVKHGWFGDYPDWESAKKKCTGYDDTIILETVKRAVLKVKNGEAVYERDSVLFDHIEFSEPLLNAFKLVSAEHQNNLRIIDFGGSLGSTYFQNRSFLKELSELSWNVVEQKHFVECGKQYVAGGQLQFYYSIPEALKNSSCDVLLLSSVIQYFEKPYELIEECLSYGFDYIIVDRTAFIDRDKERITVQVVPEFIYKASYPAWFLNERKFVDAFSGKYELLNDFDSNFDPKDVMDGIAVYRKGFVFKRKS